MCEVTKLDILKVYFKNEILNKMYMQDDKITVVLGNNRIAEIKVK